MTIKDEEAIAVARAYAKYGSHCQTAAALKISQGAVQRRLKAFEDRGLRNALRTATADAQKIQVREYAGKNKEPVSIDEIISRLRKQPMIVDEIAEAMQRPREEVLAIFEAKRQDGLNLHELGGRWSVEKAPPTRPNGVNARYELFSKPDSTYRFGFVTDNHLGSKYSRLDVLNDLYDRFERRGITHVFNAGNYIDGEARFNKFDLAVHGMDAQLRFLAENYPQRPGIITRFVAGDDHEGWYGQREGIDIGRWTERVMQEHGRNDFVYLGYMEADIDLVNAKTEKSARMRLVHPGGGSSYAVSYSMQKLIESYEGGDKPAVVLGGHYHKLEILNYRNVWSIQGGTTEDQTPFMRKKKLEAHVGGLIVDLEQDPDTGAIVCCNGIYRYFNKGYYRDPAKPRGERFSYGDKVILPARSLGGV